MPVAQEPLDDGLDAYSRPPHDLAGPELRQRSVRDLVAELARLEDSSRSAISSSRVVVGSATRAEHIIAELRRR
jgi:hypothetical protein